jgi:hypothetical protein
MRKRMNSLLDSISDWLPRRNVRIPDSVLTFAAFEDVDMVVDVCWADSVEEDEGDGPGGEEDTLSMFAGADSVFVSAGGGWVFVSGNGELVFVSGGESVVVSVTVTGTSAATLEVIVTGGGGAFFGVAARGVVVGSIWAGAEYGIALSGTTNLTLLLSNSVIRKRRVSLILVVLPSAFAFIWHTKRRVSPGDKLVTVIPGNTAVPEYCPLAEYT